MPWSFTFPATAPKVTVHRASRLGRGLEVDQSYFIQNEPQVRSLDRIDPDKAPPPDLAVEVYAALGVHEV